MAITRKQLIKKYLDFFKSKGHKEIENSSLIPKGDPTVLFTTAGMHPIVPYLLGQKHPQGKRLVSLQKCIRTTDIDEVGDPTHHTLFEMLGNWSLGDYWKKEAIEFSFEFLTKELKIPKEKISVTCFKGDKDAPKDEESAKIWKSLGVSKIKFLGKKDNWWGPAGSTGPCGPDTEMFVRGIEIWNDVFMQYNKDEKGKFALASQKNVDTGMGVERTLAILNGLEDNYLTEAWQPIIEKIEELSNRKYKDHQERMRIIADHIKASIFLIANGVMPSNKEQGYVLRRLIRRAIRHGMKLSLKTFISKIAEPIFKIYDDYENLIRNKNSILKILQDEEEKFNKTIENGLRIFDKKVMEWVDNNKKSVKILSGKDVFLLYQSYGFPLEMIEEEISNFRKGLPLKIDKKGFEEELKKHQELSRTASSGKFKSGLADHSEETTKLHTAHHLLLAALRKMLGKEVLQKGSNITPERLRLDFSFNRKLTDEEIKKVEDLVNEQIKRHLQVSIKETSPEKALKEGAFGVFGDKYGKVVSVYSIGDFSKEICTGPHVKNTKELGHFKILKEEASSAGVRRIKAVLV